MSLTADTELGRLQGVAHGGVVQFRGVPYARPPLGGLRFRPPCPHEPWPGRLDVRAHGPIAPQGPSRLRVAVGDFSRPQSEDCLTLTITTPAPDGARRPVIVWLHGGGYGTGAGSLDWYDGASLAREGDVVVVGVNYRLGPLGYLAGAGLGDGQMGLRDMIAAIGWVAAHIASFGGDPGEITLMGQSAGAHSALCMLAMPDVRRLFRRVILQSAPAGIAPFPAAHAAGWTRRYLGVLGLTGLPHAGERPGRRHDRGRLRAALSPVRRAGGAGRGWSLGLPAGLGSRRVAARRLPLPGAAADLRCRTGLGGCANARWHWQ